MDRPIVPPLAAQLGYRLRLAANHAAQALARDLAPCGVTVAEWVVLRDLYDSGPVAPSVVAGRLGLTRGAVTRLVDRLRAKALVVRVGSGPDRRFQTIALTGGGAELVPVLAAVAERSDAEMFAALPARSRAALMAALREIAAAGRGGIG